MKLDSQYIHKTLELLDEEKIKNYKNLIMDIEAVDKGDLQFFVLQLWDAFQQCREDCIRLNAFLDELNEKYNDVCSELKHEKVTGPCAQD